MKKIFYSVMALAALAACNKEQVSTAPEFDENEICLTSASVNVATKTPVEGTEFSGQTAIVLASTVAGNFSSGNLYGPTTNMYMKFNGSDPAGFCTSTGTSTPKYYDGDNNTYLVGLYPTSWGTPGTDTYTLTIDGKTDAMASAPITVNKANNAGDGTPGNLVFQHKLTKLLVNAKASEGEDYWGKITGIELTAAGGTNLQKTISVSATDMTSFDFEGAGTADPLPFYSWTGENNYTDDSTLEVELSSTATDIAYTLCAPITADGTDDFKVKITLDNGNAYEVNVGLKKSDTAGGGAFEGDTAGYAFTIALDFKATIIEATATITNWNVGGTSNIIVEPGDIVE